MKCTRYYIINMSLWQPERTVKTACGLDANRDNSVRGRDNAAALRPRNSPHGGGEEIGTDIVQNVAVHARENIQQKTPTTSTPIL